LRQCPCTIPSTGSLPCGPAPEVEALIEKLGEEWDELDFEYNDETGNFAVVGGVGTNYDGAEELDESLKALGKYAAEAQLFTYDKGGGDGGETGAHTSL
jgi:hypothetical protein